MQISQKMVCHFSCGRSVICVYWLLDHRLVPECNRQGTDPFVMSWEVLLLCVCTFVKTPFHCPMASVQTLIQAVLSRGGSELGALLFRTGQ